MSGEPRQLLGAAPAPDHRWVLAAALRDSARTTCAQQPANPICLLDKQFHILSRKGFRTTAKTRSLHCFLPCAVTTRPHGMAGDGDLPQSKYKYLGFPNGHVTSAGHTGKSSPRSHPGSHCWSRCHQPPLCIDPTLPSATACTGCFECCTKCILG